MLVGTTNLSLDKLYKIYIKCIIQDGKIISNRYVKYSYKLL
jgi:hypothetical protein